MCVHIVTHTFVYVHVCTHMILYVYACLHVLPHLHRYLNIFQTITHMAQSLTLISNLLRSWDLCPQQRPQSWPCLQWWGSQAVTLWSRHKSGLQCNLPINGRILSAAGNFCPLFSALDCPRGTEVFTGTATLAQGLKAFTEEAPALISAYLHMACSWWHCELRRWFGWSWLLSFLLKASTSRCPRISQDIPGDLRAFLQILQRSASFYYRIFFKSLLSRLQGLVWAIASPWMWFE